MLNITTNTTQEQLEAVDLTELEQRLQALEKMVLTNSFSAPLNIGTKANPVLLLDSDGKAIGINW